MTTTLGTAAAAKLLLALTVLPTPTASEIRAQLEQPTLSIQKITSLSQLAMSPINATTATTVNSTANAANIELIVELARPTTSHESIIGEIREWGLLGADWDGEGAALPSTQSMKEAVSFVRLLDNEIMPPEPMLLASGNAALYWNVNNLYADIEFLGDSRISYFIKRNEDKHKGVLAFDSEKMPAVFSTLLKA